MNLAVGNDLRRACKHGPRLAVTVAEAETAILAAARRLSIGLTSHADLLERSQAAVTRLDVGIRDATQSGQLKFFNQEYSRRRREAAALGRDFMSYQHACRRLRDVLANLAAGRIAGTETNAEICTAVFGPRPKSGQGRTR